MSLDSLLFENLDHSLPPSRRSCDPPVDICQQFYYYYLALARESVCWRIGESLGPLSFGALRECRLDVTDSARSECWRALAVQLAHRV